MYSSKSEIVAPHSCIEQVSCICLTNTIKEILRLCTSHGGHDDNMIDTFSIHDSIECVESPKIIYLIRATIRESEGGCSQRGRG